MTTDTRPTPIDVVEHRIYIGRRYPNDDREPHVWVRPIPKSDHPDFDPYSLNDALTSSRLPTPPGSALADRIDSDDPMFDWGQLGFSDPERLLAYAILCDATGSRAEADNWRDDFANEVLTEIDGTQWAMKTTWDWFQPNPTLEDWLAVGDQ